LIEKGDVKVFSLFFSLFYSSLTFFR